MGAPGSEGAGRWGSRRGFKTEGTRARSPLVPRFSERPPGHGDTGTRLSWSLLPLRVPTRTLHPARSWPGPCGLPLLPRTPPSAAPGPARPPSAGTGWGTPVAFYSRLCWCGCWTFPIKVKNDFHLQPKSVLVPRSHSSRCPLSQTPPGHGSSTPNLVLLERGARLPCPQPHPRLRCSGRGWRLSSRSRPQTCLKSRVHASGMCLNPSAHPP